MRDPNSERTKPLIFVGDAEDEIFAMPMEVKRAFGYSLRDIQNGATPVNASPFEGSKASEIMKLTQRHNSDTYRCVYAAKFAQVIYVLYVFQKKSKSVIATPQKDIDVVYTRYAAANKDYQERFGDKGNE